MLLHFNKAFTYDTCRSEPVTVRADEVALLSGCAVGERSQGCEITMRCGEQFKVWESYQQVNRAVMAALESEVVGVKA